MSASSAQEVASVLTPAARSASHQFPLSHSYLCYGLSVASAFALPELDRIDSNSPSDAELTITRGSVAGPMPAAGSDRLVEISGRRAYFAWTGLGRIVAEDGRHITVDPEPEFDLDVISLVLLGPIMAAILHQRDHMILHGSCVSPGAGKAILFVGDNGAGKSSFAAACLKSGFSLINDDVIAICPQVGGAASVQPGFPSLKLSRDALSALAPLPGAALAPVPPFATKLRFRLPSFDAAQHEIAHVCLLQRSEDAIVGPQLLPIVDRLAALMRYSYLPKFGSDALSGPAAAAHFARCAALAEQVPVSLLTVPCRLDALPAAAENLRNWILQN